MTAMAQALIGAHGLDIGVISGQLKDYLQFCDFAYYAGEEFLKEFSANFGESIPEKAPCGWPVADGTPTPPSIQIFAVDFYMDSPHVSHVSLSILKESIERTVSLSDIGSNTVTRREVAIIQFVIRHSDMLSFHFSDTVKSFMLTTEEAACFVRTINRIAKK